MSGRVKQRGTNPAEDSTLTINEKILKDVHRLYVDEEKGLIPIADGLDIELLAPRKKITILLIGNHSAGKSSFINWYIEEHIQKTGVAIETQGFTFVTSGRKRETLQGNATLHLYPHFKHLLDLEGVVDYLTTEISSSKQKKFSLVTFVDTPGLTDADTKYPFDLDNSILFLGKFADLIFVFFDPIGQALCKRTLNIVEQLNEQRPDKMRFYLSKADEAGHEADRQKVLIQIAQELCKRPGLNKAGFDMPTIYVNGPHTRNTRCVNQIEEVCRDIEKTINLTVQSTLNQLEADCNSICNQIDARLQENSRRKSSNCQRKIWSYLVWFVGILPIFFGLIFYANQNVSHKTKTYLFGEENYAMAFDHFFQPLEKCAAFLIQDTVYFASLCATCLAAIFISYFMASQESTLKKKTIREFEEKRKFVLNYVKKQRESHYQMYLKQCVSSHDI